MDWTSTQLCSDLVYSLVYPQIFDSHKRRSDEAQTATLERGKARAQAWLEVLDKHVLGTGNAYLCGNAITIADYHAAFRFPRVRAVGTPLRGARVTTGTERAVVVGATHGSPVVRIPTGARSWEGPTRAIRGRPMGRPYRGMTS